MVAASLGDGLKGNCALPPSSCSSRLSKSGVGMGIKRLETLILARARALAASALLASSGHVDDIHGAMM